MAVIVLEDVAGFPGGMRGGVLCVGNFDGVHAGHARMLAAGRAEAVRRGVSFTIMTFDPHPAVVLRAGVARVPLTTAAQRRELLGAFSPDVVVVIPTTREFLGMTAEDFLWGVVRDALGAVLLVEGPTFTYGRGARGTVETLKESGAAMGFETVVVGAEEVALSDLTLVRVSSSLIRWLVSQGRVKDAGACLGRSYALTGAVVHGEHRGRGLGFPTANIEPPQLLPAAGIYAGVARLADGRRFRAAMSIGTNPTFAGQATTVEAYLLDFAGDLYGQVIELEFQRWLREMFPYAGAGPLVAQMKRDVEEVRGVVGF